MAGRVNAFQAIAGELEKREWNVYAYEVNQSSGGTSVVVTKDMYELSLNFKIYGSLGSKRLTDYYGKGEPFNYGVASAMLREFDGDGWSVIKVFEGKNKRGQILKFIRQGLQHA